jgi:putative membrane protein
MNALIEILPHVNATLNALAAILLVVGLVLIKRKKEAAHKWTMLSCFSVSVVFLICYLTYHQLLHQVTGSHGKSFSHPNAVILWGYRVILISHILLAVSVPFLALTTIYFGLRDNRVRHLRLAKWTFPIWLYVSVTGVVVYLMLYWL